MYSYADHMIDFVYNIPNIVLFLMINIILMGFCTICLYQLNIFPNNFQREELGSLGGFLAGVVGRMYTVSIGFVLIYY